MATFRSFEEIDAWQKARVLAKEIYSVTDREPFSKDFGLKKSDPESEYFSVVQHS